MRQFFKRIFNRHKSESTNQAFLADEPMYRWSQEELAQVKNRLESKDPNEFTLEDHQQVVDYLVQRYLPHDDTRTEAKWQEVRGKLHAQCAENYQDVLAGKVVEPQWIKENEQREQRHKTLHSAYEMSLNEFNQIIVPALARFPFASHLPQLHEEVIRHLWLASVPMTSDLSWDVKYQAKDSKDDLIRFHYTVVEVCSMLRDNYERLQKARSLGYEEVKVHVRQGCKCNQQFSDKYMKIDDVLKGYRDPEARLIPQPSSECATLESPRICSVSFITIEPMRPGDDPDFDDWLKNHLRKRS